jgi:hypothetical protein
MIRADFIISYWIILWYIAYLTGYVSQNPAPALWIALIGNLLLLLPMIYYKVKLKTLFYFVTVVLISKVFPLWTLSGIPIGKKDIMATAGLIVMYVGWLLWEDQFLVLNQLSTDILHDKYSTPAMIGMNKLFP